MPVSYIAGKGTSQARHTNLSIKVTTITAIIRPIITLDVKRPFTTPSDKMMRINLFDEAAHLLDPRRHDLGGAAVLAPGQVAGSIGAAAGLVAELPGEDGWGVFVAVDEDFDVVFVGFLDGGDVVELGVEALVGCLNDGWRRG